MSGKYEYQTEFVRKWVVHGRQEGHQEGRLVGERTALFKVLEARGFKVDDLARHRILNCTELAQFESWLQKAVTASSVQELFEASPG